MYLQRKFVIPDLLFNRRKQNRFLQSNEIGIMKHINQLDGLRFIAVFLVLIEHYAISIGRHISAGYYGVDLFFVISGFLITSILIKSDEPFTSAYKKFIGRRTLRIFPIYYLTLLILYILNYQYVTEYLLYCLTYSYNYAWVYFNIPVNAITHFWSLCVEEQFYLFWPFIILGLRYNTRLLGYVVSTLAVVCSVQLCFNIIPSINPYNLTGIFPRANSLAIGALGSIWLKENKVPIKLMESKWLEYVVYFTLILFLVTDWQLKYILFPVCSLFFILKTSHNGFSFQPLNKFLNNPFIIYTGTISYGIYIFHLPLAYYLTKHFFDPLIWNRIDFDSLGIFKKIKWNSWIIKFPLYSILTFILAHLSYKYFEKPVLSLKDKYFGYNKRNNA